MKIMDFLFVPSHNSIFDIPWALQKMPMHKVELLNCSAFDPNCSNDTQNALLLEQLEQQHYDSVISYLFIPSVSDACASKHIPYLSWTYDSPLTALFTSSIFHNTNYTFIFDKRQCERLIAKGVPHIFHLPLAVNLERTGTLNITSEDEMTFTHDISFIGSLYENNTYNAFIQQFPEYLQIKLKLYLMQNMCHWESPRPWPDFPSECIDYLYNNCHISNWNQTSLIDDPTYFGLLFYPRKLAELERITVLNALGNDFDVHLYTNSPCSYLQNVHVHSGVNYYTDMNKIFYLSKINLNITLSSIESGIPQRILDIMGCGGFVLTNYQPELDDFFEIGKDIEVFRNIEELKEKCKFYLTHEKERLNIAINGYQKIRDHFSYPHQLNKMISILQENPL